MRLIEELRAELETSDAERDRLNEVIERQAAEIERLAAARTADTPTCVGFASVPVDSC